MNSTIDAQRKISTTKLRVQTKIEQLRDMYVTETVYPQLQYRCLRKKLVSCFKRSDRKPEWIQSKCAEGKEVCPKDSHLAMKPVVHDQ